MESSAQGKSKIILITDVGSYLGSELAQKLIKDGYQVYGSGSKEPSEKLLSNPTFTFIDIDLSQPLPPHIPPFDRIIHLSSENQLNIDEPKLSLVTQKIALLSSEQTKVIVLTNINVSEKTAAQLEHFLGENLILLAVGHVYGPEMNLYSKHSINPKDSFFENNELISLISQAITSDKVILNNDGQNIIYPLFIDDATEALIKLIRTENFNRAVRTVVSNPPQNTLSISYEIQNKTRSVLNKELNLYFSGPESFEKPKPQTEIKIHSNIVEVKTPFGAGLAETLRQISENKSVKKIEEVKANKPKLPVILQEPQKVETVQETKKTKKIFKKPSFTRFTKINKAFLFILVLILVLTVRFSVNINSGINNLKSTQENLKTTNFDEALKNSQKAQKHFSSARKSISLLKPISFISPLKSLIQISDSLESSANAVESFTHGAKILSQSFSNVTTSNSQQTQLQTDEANAYFSKAYFESQYAKTLLEKSPHLPFMGTKIQNAQEGLRTMSTLSQTAQELTVALPDVVGSSQEKTYLVTLMNNMELRPGGGFIGNFAEISFKDNKLKNIKVEDVYTIDGQLKEVIAPPTVLTQKLGVKQLYLRDSNWSTDFGINAQTIRDFYRKETGKTVDGVIAVDLTLVEKLLEKIGPLKLADYNEEITSSNLFEKGQYYSEVGFFPGSTQKKDFFSALTSTLINKILEGFSQGSSTNNNSTVALFETLQEGLTQKHLMLSFDDESLTSIIHSKNWSNTIPPDSYDPNETASATKDFLAISEANVGANKVNRYLKREINYDMTIGRDADLMATLTLTYKNESPADTWPGGTYVNYLRVLAPLNSSMESYAEDGKKIDLEQIIKGQKVQTVETTQAGELTQFAKLVEVPVKTTKTFTFKYRIPKNIKLEAAPVYELYVSKQPGTLNDPFKFTFNLPAYLKIESLNGKKDSTSKQSLTLDETFLADKHYQLEVAKK